LNDKIDIGDIKTSRGNISGNQHVELALLESFESYFSLILRDVTVHDLHILLDLVSEDQLVGISLSLSEDNSLTRPVLGLYTPVNDQEICEHCQSIMEWTVNSEMINCLRSFVLQIFRQIHDSVVLLEMLAGNLTHPGRNSG
jgi:hypothetical protein